MAMLNSQMVTKNNMFFLFFFMGIHGNVKPLVNFPIVGDLPGYTWECKVDISGYLTIYNQQ
jgi:hypothetical protein